MTVTLTGRAPGALELRSTSTVTTDHCGLPGRPLALLNFWSLTVSPGGLQAIRGLCRRTEAAPRLSLDAAQYRLGSAFGSRLYRTCGGMVAPLSTAAVKFLPAAHRIFRDAAWSPSASLAASFRGLSVRITTIAGGRRLPHASARRQAIASDARLHIGYSSAGALDTLSSLHCWEVAAPPGVGSWLNNLLPQ